MTPEEFLEAQKKVQDIMKRKERKKGELKSIKERVNEEFNGCSSIIELRAKEKKYKRLISKLKSEIDEDVEEFNKLYGQVLGYIEKQS